MGQIAKYIAYDKSLRDGRIPNSLSGIPMGYLQFANIFNDGIRVFPRDQRQFSTFLSDHAGDHVFRPGNPVTLKDFRITPEQCGLVQPPRFATLTEAQSIVFQEYATQKALDEVKKHEAIKERQDKRDNVGGMQNYNKKRKRNNNQGQWYYEDPSLIQDIGDDHSTHDYHSSPHYPNPSIHSLTPSPTVISQNLSNEQIL